MLERYMIPPNGYIKAPHPEASIPSNARMIGMYLNNGWVAQRKINGRRIQIHIPADAKDPILFFTRNGSLHTMPVNPSLTTILRQLYSPLSGRNVIEGEYLPQRQRIFLFDFIMDNDIVLTHETYLDRYTRLKTDFISPSLCVLPLIKSVNKCLDIMNEKDDETEGLVFKAINSTSFDSSTIVRCRKLPTQP